MKDMIMIDQKITEKMFFKGFTNTDTKFLRYLAKLLSFLSLWMTGYSCFE